MYDGDTQIGCHFGRTEKVDDHDIFELIEAEDEDKDFYILNNHICPYQRTDSWVHANDEDIVAAVEKEVYMPWAALLFYRHNGVDAVEERIKELKQQKITPKVTVLVIDPQDIDPDEFRSLHQMMEDNFDIWYLQRVFEFGLPDRFTGDLCFDKFKKHRFMFYTEISAPMGSRKIITGKPGTWISNLSGFPWTKNPMSGLKMTNEADPFPAFRRHPRHTARALSTTGRSVGPRRPESSRS